MHGGIKDESTPSREARHLMIVNNFAKLNMAIEELQDVLDKVWGRDVNKACELSPDKPAPMCLAEFLETMPDRIEKQVAHIRDIREGLYTALF